VADGTITDILKDTDELDHEDFGDFSIAYDAEEDDEEEDEDKHEDEESGGERNDR